MLEFKKIVLTTDLSPNSDAAEPYAVDLARKYGGTIHMLHVVVETVYYANAPGGEPMVLAAPAEWLNKAREEHINLLKSKAEALGASSGVPVVDVLRYGHAANEIVAYIKDEKPDLVVIATHGRTGISHLIFGSVAERVVRLSTSPVLCVHPLHSAGK